MVELRLQQSNIEEKSLQSAKFNVGSHVVIDSSHPLFPQEAGIITARPSPNAAIVELPSGNREYVQLKYLQPLCDHKFFPVWQQDSSLIEMCRCGETRSPSPATLATAKEQCLSAKNQYSQLALKSKGKRRQELLEAVELTTKQLLWLESHILDMPVTTSTNLNQFEEAKTEFNWTQNFLLSPEEEQLRLQLERKVERAFYEAGCALRELREHRLYRSTHQTFEE